jgi:hypothetical protein
MEPGYYSLQNFTDAEIELARVYILKAVEGLIHIKANEYSHKIIGLVKQREQFRGQDVFETTISISTLGNDILLAIGVAQLELSKIKEV